MMDHALGVRFCVTHRQRKAAGQLSIGHIL